MVEKLPLLTYIKTRGLREDFKEERHCIKSGLRMNRVVVISGSEKEERSKGLHYETLFFFPTEKETLKSFFMRRQRDNARHYLLIFVFTIYKSSCNLTVII